jgi:hypothetical protein
VSAVVGRACGRRWRMSAAVHSGHGAGHVICGSWRALDVRCDRKRGRGRTIGGRGQGAHPATAGPMRRRGRRPIAAARGVVIAIACRGQYAPGKPVTSSLVRKPFTLSIVNATMSRTESPRDLPIGVCSIPWAILQRRTRSTGARAAGVHGRRVRAGRRARNRYVGVLASGGQNAGGGEEQECTNVVFMDPTIHVFARHGQARGTAMAGTGRRNNKHRASSAARCCGNARALTQSSTSAGFFS